MTVLIAEMSLREVLRRRSALALLVLLPSALLGTGQSTRLIALGLGWAVASVTFVVFRGGAAVDPRLRLAGYTPAQLAFGRIAALSAVGLLLCAVFLGLIRLDQEPKRFWALALAFVVTVLIAPVVGALVARPVAGDLEGTLALMALVALQLLVDERHPAALLLPFWSVREIGGYAFADHGFQPVPAALAHAAVVLLVATAALLAVTRTGLRPPRRGGRTWS